MFMADFHVVGDTGGCMHLFDVIVLGGGNAGLCAALSARESGARVALIERAPEQLKGGNSAHTGGAFRVAYRGNDDLRSEERRVGKDWRTRRARGRGTEG